MNVLAAMTETLQLAKSFGMDNIDNPDRPAFQYEHILDMHNQVHNNPEQFSEGKRNRWLAWMQAAVYATCIDTTLDMFKDINKRWS